MNDNNPSETEFNWSEETITQHSLLAKKLAPLDCLVEDLLPTPGLAVLAGKKKTGKSWLTLQLAQCVASGKTFLGKATRRGSVLYLALEDGERRLKHRLERQGAKDELHIRYASWWPPINSMEGFKALAEIVKLKEYALVVIDTLTSARDKSAKENESDSMGELFNSLHDMAITLNTVILMVSHHGKKLHQDVGFDIRGSSAIPGATDTNIGLYKNNDGTCSLKAEGRDIPWVELRIKFDNEETWSWQLLDDDRDIRRVEAESRILKVLERLGKASASDIAEELQISRPTAYTHLKRMRTEGRVKCKELRTAKGVIFLYRLPRGATSPTHLLNKMTSKNKDSSETEQGGRRQVGEVGAEPRSSNNQGYNKK
jgi:archaellum biogenesis ATPase FlaH/DNA-binding transcriptional ArsR family regulator